MSMIEALMNCLWSGAHCTEIAPRGFSSGPWV